MIKALIFDMDGVIIDSHPIHRKTWKKFLASMGKQVTEEELDFVLDGRKKEDILCHFLGELTPEQVKRFGHEKETMFREEALDLQTLAGLRDFLEEVHTTGLYTALASSGSRSRVHYVLDKLSLNKYFDVVVTGDDVSKSKPDPTIFRKAAHGLKYHRSHLLVIEDAVSGVRAAKSAGMRCLGIGSNGRAHLLLEAGADCVVTDFTGLSLASVNRMLASSSPKTALHVFQS
jgi:beta-phosphoglucomutase